MGPVAAAGVQCTAVCRPSTFEEDHHLPQQLCVRATGKTPVCKGFTGHVFLCLFLPSPAAALGAALAQYLHGLCCLQEVDVSINYLWAALMFICPMIGAVLYVHSSRLSIIVQIKMRAELTAAVYRKALALSSR